MASKERTIVAGVGLKSESPENIKSSLWEIEDLVIAAGGEVVGSVTQILKTFVPATLLGSGKVAEIKSLVKDSQAELLVVDHQLSGIQIRNLQKSVEIRVIDRNQLILDIFALRAQTYEGKLQVQLAQLLDQLPKMVGAWMGSLSRTGGGIGTRGPGETALETDRRQIRQRVQQIRKKLDSVRKNRRLQRQARNRQGVPKFALIGYTNAGKSSLLNALTQSQILAKDQVFATLDPTTRKVFLSPGCEGVLTDTVGFIRKLPPQLIEAFKATLEESADADILLHVVDMSSDQMELQIETVDQLIREFNWHLKPILYLFNKSDIADVSRQFHVNYSPHVIVSAKNGTGLESLKILMADLAQDLTVEVELYFSKDQESQIYELSRESTIKEKEESHTGTVLKALIPQKHLKKWQCFKIEGSVPS